MAVSYYATRLSENISETPEGYLICRDAVLARTGFQEYNFSDLPQQQAAALGLNSPAVKIIRLYRAPEEVFSHATIASFEGKPFTDDHPKKFLAPEASAEFFAIRDYQCGHVQNVRPGAMPLSSGDLPLLGDIIVTSKSLIGKILAGSRELSCGYGYDIALRNDQVWQINILGNHVALVRKGRAGPEARINDAGPNEVSAAPDGAEAKAGNKPKEKPRVNNLLKHLLGIGFQNYAKDADPEKVTEAAHAIAGYGRDADEPKHKENDPDCQCKDCMDKRAKDKKAKDAEESEAAKKKADEEAKAKDAAKGKDRRSRMADAFGKLLDEMGVEAGGETAEASDADMEELADLLEEYFDEEADEPQHSEDKKAKDKRAKDSALIVEPVGGDAAASGNDAAILNELRPFVVKSGDESFKNWFNSRATAANGKHRKANGTGRDSYAAASGAASARGAHAGRSQQEINARFDAAYAARHKKNPQEVK